MSDRWEQEAKRKVALLGLLFPHLLKFDPETEQTDTKQLWEALEALDELIDRRIEDRLDQEFDRGDYRP